MNQEQTHKKCLKKRAYLLCSDLQTTRSSSELGSGSELYECTAPLLGKIRVVRGCKLVGENVNRITGMADGLTLCHLSLRQISNEQFCKNGHRKQQFFFFYFG